MIKIQDYNPEIESAIDDLVFEINIPNNVTRKAIEDASAGKGKKFNSLGKLFEDLKS